MKTFVDLFAGIGGFRLALEQLGMKCLMTSEICPHAKKIYSANFPGKIDGDLAKIKEFPKADMVVAGFPCQPFSRLRNNYGSKHSADNCFDLVINTIGKIRPKVFLLENVPALAQGRNKVFFETKLARLLDLGYKINYSILDALNFVPQRRKRLFILGGFDYHFFPNIHSHEKRTVEMIMEDNVPTEFLISSQTMVRYHEHTEKQQAKGRNYRINIVQKDTPCLLYTSPSPRDS